MIYYLFNKLLGILGSSQINAEQPEVPMLATRAPTDAKILAISFINYPPSFFSCFIYHDNSYNYCMVIQIFYRLLEES